MNHIPLAPWTNKNFKKKGSWVFSDFEGKCFHLKQSKELNSFPFKAIIFSLIKFHRKFVFEWLTRWHIIGRIGLEEFRVVVLLGNNHCELWRPCLIQKLARLQNITQPWLQKIYYVHQREIEVYGQSYKNLNYLIQFNVQHLIELRFANSIPAHEQTI